MSADTSPVVDRSGNVMFRCGGCGAPISGVDILQLGMRLPDPGEGSDEYLDAELIDTFRHERCVGRDKGELTRRIDRAMRSR
jgi:hypothetical protein